MEDGSPVCRARGTQGAPQLISDGAGGVIMVWEDQRGHFGYSDVFAQRFDVQGHALWTPDGIPVYTGEYDQSEPQIVTDGLGGAIIVWFYQHPVLDPFLHAQRIDANGTLLWGSSGITVSLDYATGDDLQLIADGAGGAVMTWVDKRNGAGNYDIYAQRIAADGTVSWAPEGVAVCTAADNQYDPVLTTDGAGGAIIAWEDRRNADSRIYAQRVGSDGTVQWTTNGSSMSSGLASSYEPQIVSDGEGGAVMVFTGDNNGDLDIFGQRVASNGGVLWEIENPVCVATDDQTIPRLVTNGAGCYIVVWSDDRVGDNDIYAGRVDPAWGDPGWSIQGTPICTAAGSQFDHRIVPDGSGGAFITWTDYRDMDVKIYAQRIDAYGMIQWASDGLIVSSAPLYTMYARLVADSPGSVAMVWYDYRGYSIDLWAQRLDTNGDWGHPAPLIRSVRDVPGDQGGVVNLAWDASDYDPMPARITTYSIWRALSADEAVAKASDGAVVDPVVGLPKLRVDTYAGKSYYWSLVDTHDAYHLETYSQVVPTAFDSTATCGEAQYFQVIAHTSDPQVFWISAPDSGWSVDDLAPEQPGGLKGDAAYAPAGMTLAWERNAESDLAHYAVYRGLSPTFTPGPGNLVAAPADTTAFDQEWTLAAGYHYKVSALDIHGNESSHALLRPEDVTGGDTPVMPASYLRRNAPNPFNPGTKIVYGLMEPARATLRIFDASGRLVRVLVDEQRTAGPHEAFWDGNDGAGRPVASGVYFYRLDAGAFGRTERMTLVR
ncbi:hypothetical protein KJ554_04705 [bacterium]|nr:hypothetical protein [bacterium]